MTRLHLTSRPLAVATATLALLAASGAGLAQPVNVLPDIPRGDIAVQLHTVASGLAAPDYGTFAPGSPQRLYVVEQNGLLRTLDNGVLQPGAVLDLGPRMAGAFNPANANDERGFLGLAFHPDYARSGRAGFQTLYTFHTELIAPGTVPTYVAPNGAVQNFKTVVAEWKMGAGGTVDPSSYREVISFGKNANNHNGGTIAFGPDNYLYLGLGDGGNARDVGPSHIEPGGNAQNMSTPLGKMLRFDPLAPALTGGSADRTSANGQYRIPVSNPFQAPGQVAETFALGFRNPYRFAFDRTDLGGNGDLILADVGQGTVEEINRVIMGGNYGWAVKEGTFLFNRTDPDGAGPLTAGSVGADSPGAPAGLIDPIQGTLSMLQYDHNDGISITGGFVYRGDDIPELYGKYVFGDLALRNAPPRVDGRLFYADLVTGQIFEFELPQFANGRLPDGLTVHGFGEDASGEIYAMVTNTPANGSGGLVYMFAPVPEPATWASLGLGLLGLGTWRLRRRGA